MGRHIRSGHEVPVTTAHFRDSEDGVGGGPKIDALKRVEALAPQIAAASERIEQERRLPSPLLDAMIDAGMFRLLLPRAFGGYELDPPSFAQAIETVARNDASAAWCLCQNTVCATVAAFMAPEIAEQIFGRDPRAILAWGPGPGSRAVAVEGGYRVTGKFAFASGGRHANWLGAYCPIFEADGTPRQTADGKPAARTMLFPAAEAAMTDIWHVIGLKGTASDAYAVTELFVPEAHTVLRDDQSERRCDSPLYCYPTNSLFASGFASVALGLARSLLDSLIALAREKTPRGYKHALARDSVAQTEIAEAEARLRGARMFLMGTLTEVWREVARKNTLSLEQRMAIRLAASHGIQEAVKVADAAYHAAGATAVFASNPFERRFRDIHTVAQQIQGRRSHFENVGKFIFGLEVDTTFL